MVPLGFLPGLIIPLQFELKDFELEISVIWFGIEEKEKAIGDINVAMVETCQQLKFADICEPQTFCYEICYPFCPRLCLPEGKFHLDFFPILQRVEVIQQEPDYCWSPCRKQLFCCCAIIDLFNRIIEYYYM